MTDIREPANPTELRAALKIGKPNQHREVEIWRSKTVYSNRANSDHHFDIDVHPDSELVIYVLNGLPFLKVKRGASHNVKVVFESSWGNSLEILPGQGATVEVPDSDTKTTLSGDGRDLKVIAPEGKNRVRNYTYADADVIARQYA